jgi:hypothetical protein
VVIARRVHFGHPASEHYAPDAVSENLLISRNSLVDSQ